MDRSKGFSLVEMMLVLAILAVLVSLLLPTLSSAREASRKMDCAGRQKQMYTMTLLYHMDNRQYWPIHYQAYSATAGVPGYRLALNMYFLFTKTNNRRDWGKANPMICLASKSIDAPSTTFWGTPGFPWPWDGIDSQGRVYATEPATSYTINPYFYEGGYGGVPANRPRRGMPAKPHLTMLYVDAWREARPHYWYVSNGKSFMRFRHGETTPTASNGSLNMTYTDGSVRNWLFEIGGPIYPVSGNGLFTTQPGFMWSPLP